MTPEPTISRAELYAHLAAHEFSGGTTGEEEQVGLEGEFFLLHAGAESVADAQVHALPENEKRGRPTIFAWLDAMSSAQSWQRVEDDSPYTPAWILPSGGRITLEPGGQVECSTIPYGDADAALDELERVEKLLREAATAENLHLQARGFLGHDHTESPELVVRKPRYLLMDQHFRSLGEYGRLMMRSTCSMQVNLDFGSGEEVMRRWRLANHLAPLLATLFTTSSVRWRGEEHPNFRREIWRRTDPTRTGVPEGITGSDPIGAYLEFALDATVIFLDDLRAGPRAPAIPTTFRSWLTPAVAEQLGGYPDLDDWKRHLTTLFPEVRPRGFIEIRSLDAMPAELRRAAVSAVVAALYDEGRCRELLKIFEAEGKKPADRSSTRQSILRVISGA